ncbi:MULTISPECIES: hypothetical protein [unclassified Aeromonas]|uniref:hypothetical protein n=1 Tax=unclassified Aeromonas TaxID=257493 RepID=UPI00084ABD3E|nr:MULTISPECIES: hypothetical protein [unclassified Aeromonas]OEC54244.1 hypothetical protein A9G04_04225 [Aeromonas sp. ANNP30]OEC66760.1 hypothetical protein A9G49_03970 [Aeromonas sp. ANP5]
MTIIASYNIHGCKVLFADLLITSEEINESTIVLPTLGEIDSRRVDNRFFIAERLQKIQIISDYCTIAYAGNVYLAYCFIEALNKILEERVLSINDIENTYKSIDEKNELAIIYLYRNNSGEIISKGMNCCKSHSKVLGEVLYRGSGELAITDYIEWLDRQDYISCPPIDEVVAQAVSIVIQQIAQLQMAEIKSNSIPESIKDYFGSGYEIVTFYNGKFNKINLTYAFIELTYNIQTKNVDINNPYIILSQYIEDGVLIHERYQDINYPISVNNEFTEYDHNKIITSSLLDINKKVSHVLRENKLNDLNFCCFIFHDNFKYGTEMWQSIVIRSDTPPINIKKHNDERGRYDVIYSERVEIQLIEFIQNNYL